LKKSRPVGLTLFAWVVIWILCAAGARGQQQPPEKAADHTPASGAPSANSTAAATGAQTTQSTQTTQTTQSTQSTQTTQTTQTIQPKQTTQTSQTTQPKPPGCPPGQKPLANDPTKCSNPAPSADLTCPNGYVLKLNVLHDSDADGLAEALDEYFSADFSVTAVADQSKTKANSGGSAPPASPSQQAAPASPRNILCISGPQDATKTGKSPRPEWPGDSGAQLQNIVRLFDRQEYSGVGLGPSFLVQFKRMRSDEVSRLVDALPSPAPGLALDPSGLVFGLVPPYLVIEPSTDESALATKSGGDLAAQAAGVKRDLLALDSQYGEMVDEDTDGNEIGNLRNEVHNAGDGRSPGFGPAENDLERWYAKHTVYLTKLDPRDVAVQLKGIFNSRAIEVLAAQQAVAFLPNLNPANSAVLSSANTIERDALYEKSQKEKTWAQRLQSDAANAPKPTTANSASPPATTTTTTISTLPPAAGSTSKSTPTIQIQTSTPPASGSGGSASPSTAGGATGANPAASNGLGGGSVQNQAGAPGGTAAPGGTSAATQLTTPVVVAPGLIVRLYHLRQAANISVAINALSGPASTQPLVEALSDYGNDDLLLILPPAAGQPDRTEEISRLIAALDLPRPKLSLEVWSYTISTKKEKSKYDETGHLKNAKEVSDVYAQFKKKVDEADGTMQIALQRGLGYAMEKAAQAERSDSPVPFFDPDTKAYLTEDFADCVKQDDYCLGYTDALNVGPDEVASPNQTFVSLDRFLTLLASIRDDQLGYLVKKAIEAMEDKDCATNDHDTSTTLCFPAFQRALGVAIEQRNLRVLRVALLDFLFQYKWLNSYPNDFEPYELQHTAQALDGLIEPLMDALDQDLDAYVSARLQADATCVTHAHRRDVGLANFGETQVAALSGDQASVSGQVNNYFDITQPTLLSTALAGLLGSGAGGGGASSSGGNSATNTITINTTPSTSNTTSNGGGSGGSGSKTGAAAVGFTGPLASMITPWQAVALQAFSALAAPPQLSAQVNAQTTLNILPVSLDTANSAELDVSLAISQPTSTISASTASTSFIRQDMANSVANFSVQSKVRVDSLKLFQLSSLSMDITHPESPVPFPIIGWVYDALFGTVPGMNDHFPAIPRDPKTIQNRTIAIVRAVIVPTAMDIGLSMPFVDDRFLDPITHTIRDMSSADMTGKKLLLFHNALMSCILQGNSNCMETTKLSDLPEETYDSTGSQEQSPD
jgi:hypothetical protein